MKELSVVALLFSIVLSVISFYAFDVLKSSDAGGLPFGLTLIAIIFLTERLIRIIERTTRK
jgi:hypothetical protein